MMEMMRKLLGSGVCAGSRRFLYFAWFKNYQFLFYPTASSVEQIWLDWWLIPALLVASSSGWQVGPGTSPSHSWRTEQGE